MSGGLYERLFVRWSKRASRRRLDELIAAAAERYALARRSEETPLVLNVGAGGAIGALLERAGVRARQVDIDPSRGPDVVADLTDLAPFDDGSVSALLCFEVLEHVADPWAAAREIERVLVPGGLVIGSTPFLLPEHDAPADYYRFTRHGLRRVFERFEPLEITARDGQLGAALVVALRLFLADERSDRLLAVLLSPLLALLSAPAAALDGLLRGQQGTTGYFFVFRKPNAPRA
ncbi:MAG: class I SAM-dependent methyltransferase [Myxococcales bacterium]|nr:class I SAM-dependent methyltransferase [Myxococcales bacterium]